MEHHIRQTALPYQKSGRTFYVTYELTPTGSQQAKRFLIPGTARQWTVGQYSLATGRRTHALKLTFETDEGFFDFRVIEVPVNARNVELHAGALPHDFRPERIEDAA